MTINTNPHNANDTNADTAAKDKAEQRPDLVTLADNSTAGATDPAILTRRDDNGVVFVYDGRGRRPSTIL